MTVSILQIVEYSETAESKGPTDEDFSISV
jgi:hypothetical protein